MGYFNADFIQFFIELAANNHKDWFDMNRVRYEQSVKKPFAIFTQTFINRLALKHPVFQDLLAKDCIFRINRDIRFSKDKTPYKLMCSAVVSPEGKKSTAIHGIYFELSPEHVRVYGGVYEIDKHDLMDLREGLSANLPEFQKLIANPEFVEFFGEIHGDKNKMLPSNLRGAAEQEALIFNKQFYFYATFSPDLILQDELLDTMIKAYEIGKPLELFFNQFIHRP